MVMGYPETASPPGPNELGYVSYPHSLLAHHMICFLGGITGINPGVEISLACDVCCGPCVAHGTCATPQDDPGRPLSAPQCPLHVASAIAPRYTRITYPSPHQGSRNNSWQLNCSRLCPRKPRARSRPRPSHLNLGVREFRSASPGDPRIKGIRHLTCVCAGTCCPTTPRAIPGGFIIIDVARIDVSPVQFCSRSRPTQTRLPDSHRVRVPLPPPLQKSGGR